MPVDRRTEYIDDRVGEFLEELEALLAQPSVSATGEGVAECTEMLTELCEEYGFDAVNRIETPGQPVIVARAYVDSDPDSDAPTVFMYGHYDVQPADPDQWTSPPFEPTVREGPTGEPHIYARGISDMKAQLFAHICAVRVLRETGGLPTNLILLLEGEEESGSPNLEPVVKDQKEELQADIVYYSDGTVHESGRPYIYLGDRGLVAFQVNVTGANRELHSGLYGGPVPNPVEELARLVMTMRDDDGRIAIDGVYDDVLAPTDAERDALERMPVDETQIKTDLELKNFAPGPGESFSERLMFYPTLTISGFSGGYTGEGKKTSIPNEALFKADMRLVPEQDPDDIYEKIVRHVGQYGANEVEFEVTRLTDGPRSNWASGTPIDSPLKKLFETAVHEVWDKDPIVVPRAGASGPLDIFERHVGAHSFIVPYGSPESRRHAPDENMSIQAFRNGIMMSTRVLNDAADHFSE